MLLTFFAVGDKITFCPWNGKPRLGVVFGFLLKYRNGEITAKEIYLFLLPQGEKKTRLLSFIRGFFFNAFSFPGFFSEVSFT